MRKSFILFFTALLIGVAFPSQAQDNMKMQSVFLYNFSRLVSWPSSYQNGDFVIGVLGNSPILSELNDMAASKKVGGQNIVIRKFNNPQEIDKCHIVYIPTSQSRKVQEVASHLKSKKLNSLIVSDQNGATKNGAVINFVLEDNRQRFELSDANARSMGLVLGAEIQRLAIMVN